MCDVYTGAKTASLESLKCSCGCTDIVIRSYPKQYRLTGRKSTYITTGSINCNKCGETLLTWVM
jgi:hypothetical protein